MIQSNEHGTLPPSMDPAAGGGVVEPPTHLLGIVKRLGPGLIIAGSIVGSGELIATTKTGAQGGISLLWLIIIGCLIKVFVQIELGRYTISHGETTLAALDRVPGPRCTFGWVPGGTRMGANWIVWCWLLMLLVGIGGLGGIVGGVGQAAALVMPITGDYIDAIRIPSQKEIERFIKWEDDLNGGAIELSKLSLRRQESIKGGQKVFREKVEQLLAEGDDVVVKVRAGEKIVDPWTRDDKIWAAMVALLTAGLLYRGRYRMIQNISMALVVTFTIITIVNVFALQTTEQYHISASEFMRGLFFGWPEAVGDSKPIVTALATFGMIGVGASELIAYPYWCLEKGYASFTGPRSDDESWARRARGWMKVMHYDAFLSMVIYTVATLAFFVMGAGVLYNEGRDPDGMRMVSTLAAAYVPVFGEYARWLFLIGAVAVLYSTFLIATAGNARMLTDSFKVFGLMQRHNQQTHDRSVTALSVFLPLLCLAVFCTGINPVLAILLSGGIQALLLPMIGVGALFLRYTRTDKRLQPSRLWDVLVIVSCIGLLIAGVWGAFNWLF